MYISTRNIVNNYIVYHINHIIKENIKYLLIILKKKINPTLINSQK